MFAARFFANRFFPGRYFPHAGLVGAVVGLLMRRRRFLTLPA
jgi:hypothetical protein